MYYTCLSNPLTHRIHNTLDLDEFQCFIYIHILREERLLHTSLILGHSFQRPSLLLGQISNALR